MFNQDLLKKINILYVEDEAQIRDSMVNVFKKLFKEVFVAVDGNEGIEVYKSVTQDQNKPVDIIISDINMPIMSGLDMLSEIKKIDRTIPFILTTAHAETDYFLDAIKLGVIHYALKPLNIKDLMFQIQDVCMLKYQKMVSANKENENSRYMDIIDKVAIVTRTDLKGNITYVNDIFCEVSGYSEDELVGSNHRMVKHSDMPKSAFDDLWNTLREKKAWKGKIKNKHKDGSAYIVNANIFPIFDETGENVVEYMAVRFLITDEEEEKREFKRKVIQNIQTQKKKEHELTNQVKDLERKLKLSTNDDMSLMQEALDIEKKKATKSKTQVLHYEKDLETEKARYKKMFDETKVRINSLVEESKEAREALAKYKNKALELQLQVTAQSNEIKRLEEVVENQAKTNSDLKEVIAHREEQLTKRR